MLGLSACYDQRHTCILKSIKHPAKVFVVHNANFMTTALWMKQVEIEESDCI